MISKIVDIHTHNHPSRHLTISSYGVHPYHAEGVSPPIDASLFEGYDAVGEVGLDYTCSTPKECQQKIFEAQLEIAQQLSKIVVIHCVRGYNEVLATLKRYTLPTVIFHGFIGSVQLMSQIVERGYYISYGDRMLSSPKSIEALRRTPLDRLFFESDESEVDVEVLYKQASQIMGIDEGRLRDEIYKNYRKILNYE